jgi:hypothetical protein
MVFNFINIYIYIYTHARADSYIPGVFCSVHWEATVEGVTLEDVLHDKDTKSLKTVEWHKEGGGETLEFFQDSIA